MTEDIIARARANSRTIDRVDRHEATHSADARKARQVVRDLKSGSLPAIAGAMVRSITDLGERHNLEQAIDRFRAANDQFAREELKAAGWLLEWAGGSGNGVLPALPATAPEHKIEMALAWNNLLDCVNQLTKVGVCKRHRERPIELMVDIEAGPALVRPPKIEWE